MTSKCFLQAIPLTAIAICTMATNAHASTITYSTDAPGTQFVFPITGLSLNSSSGLAATLSFQPDVDIAIGVPSNINYGLFTLVCSTCLTNHTDSAIFAPFTFDLIITDQTDGGATGEFVGTSTGGAVAFNSSTITVSWQPVQLGPGTNHALTGSFGSSFFNISPQTLIVAPNSGANVGQTTVQGSLNAVPEPATMGLIGAGLIGLGLLRRKRTSIK